MKLSCAASIFPQYRLIWLAIVLQRFRQSEVFPSHPRAFFTGDGNWILHLLQGKQVFYHWIIVPWYRQPSTALLYVGWYCVCICLQSFTSNSPWEYLDWMWIFMYANHVICHWAVTWSNPNCLLPLFRAGGSSPPPLCPCCLLSGLMLRGPPASGRPQVQSPASRAKGWQVKGDVKDLESIACWCWPRQTKTGLLIQQKPASYGHDHWHLQFQVLRWKVMWTFLA